MRERGLARVAFKKAGAAAGAGEGSGAVAVCVGVQVQVRVGVELESEGGDDVDSLAGDQLGQNSVGYTKKGRSRVFGCNAILGCLFIRQSISERPCVVAPKQH